jgi:hypothetical protein
VAFEISSFLFIVVHIHPDGEQDGLYRNHQSKQQDSHRRFGNVTVSVIHDKKPDGEWN